MTIKTWALLGLLALLACAKSASAAQSYDNCTGFITSVPATISTQGTWCLKQDLATAITSGNAITINTNNVTIDCNDFKLGGLAAGAATLTIGIRADDHVNLTVRHCNIRGFYSGLQFQGLDTGGHAIEENRFDGNTSSGMYVDGEGSIVQRNRVFDTGGTTQSNDAYGIRTNSSVDVLNNLVSGVTARIGGGGHAFGINTTSNTSGRIIGNGVRGLLRDTGGFAYGIWNISSGRLSLRGNDLVGSGTNSVGLVCNSANDSAQDNLISGFATAIITCANDADNIIKP